MLRKSWTSSWGKSTVAILKNKTKNKKIQVETSASKISRNNNNPKPKIRPKSKCQKLNNRFKSRSSLRKSKMLRSHNLSQHRLWFHKKRKFYPNLRKTKCFRNLRFRCKNLKHKWSSALKTNKVWLIKSFRPLSFLQMRKSSHWPHLLKLLLPLFQKTSPLLKYL